MTINGGAFGFSTPLTLPSGGVLTVQANGDFTYVPLASSVYFDVFTYNVTDGTATSN